ncbi:hypothetical protein FV218_22230 [Methylobacterium sp. WL69]|uniref:hypothetical protein n=1 Tax=Methylobacterium sp. WL69 TaxID=2603893 RepID=UPI0011CAC42A|nr:hypothetical protein [Methylobacterium sp. WL69]TXM64330.1 hypothetical protein FV218_22230 [Methylobacterium sp. WL69]
MFDDLDDDMQDALDDAYGERVRVEPRGSAGWRTGGGIDTERPVREIIGRYRSKPMTSELEGNREGSRFQSMTRIAGNTLSLRVSPLQATALGYSLAANDRVVLLDRIDQPAFTVVRVGPRDSGELTIELTAEASA